MNYVQNYWEERYRSGGNSGLGSYGHENQFKINYIKNIIQAHSIQSINDFGCGDGNQIEGLVDLVNYKGYDISKTAVEICKERYKDASNFNFSLDFTDWTQADLCMSLDVLYHIVEDDLFYEYVMNLFNYSLSYILIYSVESNLLRSHHAKSREFVQYIISEYNCQLIETNKYPPKDRKDNGVGFYLFKK